MKQTLSAGSQLQIQGATIKALTRDLIEARETISYLRGLVKTLEHQRWEPLMARIREKDAQGQGGTDGQ